MSSRSDFRIEGFRLDCFQAGSELKESMKVLFKDSKSLLKAYMTGEIRRWIWLESAGNVIESESFITDMSILSRLKKIDKPGVFNFLGVMEKGANALLMASRDVCEIEGLSAKSTFIEITRIVIAEDYRNLGFFMSFVSRMHAICSQLQKALVLGCVEGNRMKELVEKHPCTWKRLRSDPTSFVYLPSIAGSDPSVPRL